MSYCATSDVQADFKSVVFTTTSLVTTASVAQFITEASALIDSYVGQRFVTPITGDASSLALMSLYCRTLVATRVRGILENKQTTNLDANQNVKADGFTVKDVMTALTAIKNGELQLSGASLILAGAGFFSNNSQNGEQPVMQKDRRQW